MSQPSKKVSIGGFIHWGETPSFTHCQTCGAIVDVDSRISLNQHQPVKAELKWTVKNGQRYLLIMELDD